MPSLLSFNVDRPLSVRTLASAVGVQAPISLRAIMTRLADPRRPFYLIAHRCNDLEEVQAMISAGANAIECDIQFTDSQRDVGGIEFVVNHDHANNPRRDSLIPYLQGVVEILKNNPQVALWLFDLKDDNPADAVRLRNVIRKHLTDHVPINILISQAAFDSRGFFVPIKDGLRPREGYAIDQHNHPDSVSDFFATNGIARHGYGNGIFVAGGGEHVPSSVMKGAALKWSDRKIRFVYVWTLGAKAAMRDYIALGVDGIFVNDVPALKAVLAESAIKQQVVLASRARDPFAVRPYLHAYVLTIQTADQGSAGTDADLTFELHGTAGIAKATIDTSPPFMFEQGDTDRLALIGTNVGTIQKLVIVNHGGGSGPDWFVSTVKVQKSGTGAVTTFYFSQEIESGASASRTPA
jgi:glycerophosphoryl diester phosphodiesterase